MKNQKNDNNEYIDDFVNYEDCNKFIYNYQSNEKNVEIIVNIINNEFIVNGKPLNINLCDFDNCNDIDDFGIELGKKIIKDNDSEITMSFLNGGYSLSGVLPNRVYLNKDMTFKINEDESWYLTIYCDKEYSTTLYDYFEVSNKDFENIKKMIIDKDFENLSNYTWDNLPFETLEFFDIWDDDMYRKFKYEVYNENNEKIYNGDLNVSEWNVFYYDKPQIDYTNIPKYLLVKNDIIKRSSSSFLVPKNFEVGGIHFIGNYHFNGQIFDDEQYGDTLTSIFRIRYNGKFYDCVDVCDCGTYGEIRYTLFEWDEIDNKYRLVCKTEY